GAFDFERPRMPKEQKEWVEIQCGLVRIKICQEECDGQGELKKVGAEEILDSVSSRNEVRSLANVVTSGNRFLKTGHPGELVECLRNFEETPRTANSNRMKAQKASNLLQSARSLVAKEEAEAADYLKRIDEF